MLLLFGQGCGQPMQQMREGLMHGVCMWIPSRFAGGVIRVSRGGYFGGNLPVCLYSSACSLQVSFSGCRPYTFKAVIGFLQCFPPLLLET